MRWIICLLIAAALAAADYPLEREAAHTLTDGRVLVGVFDAQAGTLVMRMPSGRTSQMPMRADQIASSTPTREAEDRQAELRAAAAEARRQQAAAELAARQRERDEKAAAIQAAEAQRQAERDRLREARETAAAYEQRGLHFDPLTMSPADMHREARRIDAEADAKAQADALAALRAQRVAEEQAEAQRREAAQRERAAHQAEADQRRAQAEEAMRVDEQRRIDAAQRERDRVKPSDIAYRIFVLVLLLVVLLLIVCLPWLPSLIAYRRRHPFLTPLCIINISTSLLSLIVAVAGPDISHERIIYVVTHEIWRILTLMVYALSWIGCLAWACWPGMSRPAPTAPVADGDPSADQPRPRVNRAAAQRRAAVAAASTTPSPSIDRVLAEHDQRTTDEAQQPP